MRSWAIGIAGVAASPCGPIAPPFSTMTATAISGSSAGAKATNQECGWRGGASAVPVLPATFTPGTSASVSSSVDDNAVRGADLPNDARVHHHAVVGYRRGYQAHLEDVGGDPVLAEGDLGGVPLYPLVDRIAQVAG